MAGNEFEILNDDMMINVGGGAGIINTILSGIALFGEGDMVYRKTNPNDLGKIKRVHINDRNPLKTTYDVKFSESIWEDVPHENLIKA